MNKSIRFQSVAITFFIALSVSYLLCIAVGLAFDWTMYQSWLPLLPGFTWPVTAVGFLIGWLWIVGYALYGAAVLVLPYNYLNRQSGNRDATARSQ